MAIPRAVRLAGHPARSITATSPRTVAMCPFCLSAAAWAIATATASTGGLAALLVLRRHDHTDHSPEPTAEETSR